MPQASGAADSTHSSKSEPVLAKLLHELADRSLAAGSMSHGGFALDGSDAQSHNTYGGRVAQIAFVTRTSCRTDAARRACRRARAASAS